MSTEPAQSPESIPSGQRELLGRLRRLVLKELREILRDRRTIITLVVMPMLIYPLLAMVFQRFLITSISVPHESELMIGVESPEAQRRLRQQLDEGSKVLARRKEAGGVDEDQDRVAEGPPPTVHVVALPEDELRAHMANSSLHLIAFSHQQRDADSAEGLVLPSRWELVYRANAPTSEAALNFVESRLQAYNQEYLDRELEKLGVSAELPAATERHAVSFTGAPAFSLAALIPLILVLMTVTGAVYPAIDLTAGERERGTLETLIAAPVPRLGLLLAKYIAVLTVAMLTALVNIGGMAITAQSTGLAATLFGGGMTFTVMAKVLMLLCLFAAFFSAILLAITSYARSFKEAQAYIIPLMLVCLVPGVLCLLPGLEFTPWMAVTPLVNIVMLGRDLLEGSVAPMLAVAAVCSTLFYIAAAIAIAARIFGTDAILYGSPATWSDMMRRPAEPQPTASMSVAMLGLALMFSGYVVLGTGLAGSKELSMSQRLVVIGLVTTAVFGIFPVVLTALGRVRWDSGLGLRRPTVLALFAAALLGVALWPIAHEIFMFSESIGLSSLSRDKIDSVRDMLAQWPGLPLGLILATMALAPGVCEELCFRGFLFGALRTRLAADRAAIAAAVIFGVFHEVLAPGRFLASTFLGLVLGWVRVRTGSVIPCMLLHTIHNGLLLSVVYYRDALTARGWDMADEQHLPVTWLAASFAAVVAGGLLISLSSRKSPAAVSES